MSDWQPVTQPPSEVGLYRYGDKLDKKGAMAFMVQWDGRHFRFASGLCAGRIVAAMAGDVWRLPDRKDSGDAGQ